MCLVLNGMFWVIFSFEEEGKKNKHELERKGYRHFKSRSE